MIWLILGLLWPTLAALVAAGIGRAVGIAERETAIEKLRDERVAVIHQNGSRDA